MFLCTHWYVREGKVTENNQRPQLIILFFVCSACQFSMGTCLGFPVENELVTVLYSYNSLKDFSYVSSAISHHSKGSIKVDLTFNFFLNIQDWWSQFPRNTMQKVMSQQNLFEIRVVRGEVSSDEHMRGPVWHPRAKGGICGTLTLDVKIWKTGGRRKKPGDKQSRGPSGFSDVITLILYPLNISSW